MEGTWGVHTAYRYLQRLHNVLKREDSLTPSFDSNVPELLLSPLSLSLSLSLAPLGLAECPLL